MALNNYTTKQKQDYVYRSTNIVELINRVKLNKKKEKINTIIIATVALSVLTLSALIISL